MGLIGKLEKPTRSRRCKGSVLQNVTEANALGRRRNTMNLSQKTYLFADRRVPAKDGEEIANLVYAYMLVCFHALSVAKGLFLC